MSLMDDVFDMRDHVEKNFKMKELFSRIEERLWHYEKSHVLLRRIQVGVGDVQLAVDELESLTDPEIPDSSGE